MDIIGSLTGPLIGALSYIGPFVLVLGVVVFVHEMGHFLVGRWCGARVDAFSIGFGRPLAAWSDRHGTRWQVGWLPLGGYVKFWGDEDATSLPNAERLKKLAEDPDARHSFHFLPLWRKALIVLAGPLTNFIFAIVVFTALFTLDGKPYTPAFVAAFQQGSVGEAAGLKVGDEIVAIDGAPIETFQDVQRAVMASDGRALIMGVRRDGETLSVTVQPARVEVEDQFGNKQPMYRLGVATDSARTEVRRLDLASAFGQGAYEIYFVIERTFAFIEGVFAGREDARQVSGPIGIAKVSGEFATFGLVALITLMAYVSISIGLINLFPVPMLDGGHLLFYALEAIRRRPLGERAQEYGFRMGLALVLSLMVFATWNDLNRIFGS